MTSKIGRKGDPRMHKAVAIRLEDPNMSLFLALREGGFDYARDDLNLVDSDGVTLAQRKNQLSRRLRLAHNKEHGNKTSPRELSLSGTKRGLLEDDPALRGGEDHLDDEQGRQQPRAKDMPNYKPVVIPNIRMHAVAPTSLTAQSYPVPDEHHAMASSGVAIASLSQTAHSVGLTLEQLAVQLSSNHTLLGQLIHPDQNQRNDLAHNLFHTEVQGLYRKCLYLAGNVHVQETSSEYLDFVNRAWQREDARIRRLNQVYGRTVEEPPVDSSQSRSRSREGSDINQQQNRDDGERCVKGCHIHRLERKCGHKAILHQPPNGEAHIDFVVGDKVECYQDIVHKLTAKDVWPSKHKCVELSCEREHHSNHDEHSSNECNDMSQPKLLDIEYLKLDGPEWNVDFQEEEPVLGLFKLGSTSDK